MFKSLLLFSLLLYGTYCSAQKSLYFKREIGEKYYPIIDKYSLPASVTCTFKDGSKQLLLLEDLKGDSLIFRKYYNQPRIYDCPLSFLKKIKVHKKGEQTLYSIIPFTTATSLLFSILAFNIFLQEGSSDAGDPSRSIAFEFLIPVAALTAAVSMVIISSFPKKYYPSQYTLYVK